MAAVRAPVAASIHQWLAVATTPQVTSSGYNRHSTAAQRRLTSAAIVKPIMSAKQTCIDGIAAYGLTSTELSACTPVKSATESTNPRSGYRRGGAVGTST